MAVNLGTRPEFILQRRQQALETEREVLGPRRAGGRRSRLGWLPVLCAAALLVLIPGLPAEIPYPAPATEAVARETLARAGFHPTPARAGTIHEEHGRQESPPQVWIVARGETLWSIARTLAPGRDPRSVVESLRRANRLESAALRVGQALQIPPEFQAR